MQEAPQQQVVDPFLDVLCLIDLLEHRLYVESSNYRPQRGDKYKNINEKYSFKYDNIFSSLGFLKSKQKKALWHEISLFPKHFRVPQPFPC